MVITESKSANPQQTATASQRARQAGVNMLAVGVGVQTSVQELIGVAGRSNVANVFTLEEYKELSSLLLSINQGFCSECAVRHYFNAMAPFTFLCSFFCANTRCNLIRRT